MNRRTPSWLSCRSRSPFRADDYWNGSFRSDTVKRNRSFRSNFKGAIMVTNWRSVLTQAHTALREVVANVPADGWDRPTPCEKWTVTQVLQHATGDQVGYAAAITGGPWPTEDPFAPSGKLAGDPAATVEEAITLVDAAYAGIADDAEAVPVPLPGGPLPAWLAAGACALDAAVHAWDIAVATGQPSPLTEEQSTALHEVAERIVEPLRGFAYAPAIDPGPGADATGRLLAYLGRDEHRTAAN
jgi:uncharacterized protein (TIGR03086 family)